MVCVTYCATPQWPHSGWTAQRALAGLSGSLLQLFTVKTFLVFGRLFLAAQGFSHLAVRQRSLVQLRRRNNLYGAVPCCSQHRRSVALSVQLRRAHKLRRLNFRLGHDLGSFCPVFTFLYRPALQATHTLVKCQSQVFSLLRLLRMELHHVGVHASLDGIHLGHHLCQRTPKFACMTVVFPGL